MGRPDFQYIEYLIGPRRAFENKSYRDSHYRDTDWTFSYDAVGGNAIRNRRQSLFFIVQMQSPDAFLRVTKFDNLRRDDRPVINKEFIHKRATMFTSFLMENRIG